MSCCPDLLYQTLKDGQDTHEQLEQLVERISHPSLVHWAGECCLVDEFLFLEAASNLSGPLLEKLDVTRC